MSLGLTVVRKPIRRYALTLPPPNAHTRDGASESDGPNGQFAIHGRNIMSRTLLILIVAGLSLTVAQSPSAADGFDPNSCDRRATTTHWTNNCHVANDFSMERQGHYAIAVQWVLSGSAGLSGGVDGFCGQNCEVAIGRYESTYGTPADRRVTYSDWQSMKVNNLQHLPTLEDELYNYFGAGGVAGTVFAREKSDSDWWVYDPTDSRWEHMDYRGP